MDPSEAKRFHAEYGVGREMLATHGGILRVRTPLALWIAWPRLAHSRRAARGERA